MRIPTPQRGQCGREDRTSKGRSPPGPKPGASCQFRHARAMTSAAVRMGVAAGSRRLTEVCPHREAVIRGGDSPLPIPALRESGAPKPTGTKPAASASSATAAPTERSATTDAHPGGVPHVNCLNQGMAQVEELGGNRVRLTVDVSPHELEHAVEHAASDLAGSVKIPGFRKGKVPRQVLLANVGRDRLWVEAVESHIGSWFWSPPRKSRLCGRSRARVRLRAPREEKEPWTFSATVEVQPTPEIVDWTTLEVPRAGLSLPRSSSRRSWTL